MSGMAAGAVLLPAVGGFPVGVVVAAVWPRVPIFKVAGAGVAVGGVGFGMMVGAGHLEKKYPNTLLWRALNHRVGGIYLLGSFTAGVTALGLGLGAVVGRPFGAAIKSLVRKPHLQSFRNSEHKEK